MRNAPPVGYPAGRSPVVGRAFGLVFAFTSEVFVLYCQQAGASGGRQAGMAALAVAAYLLALRQWRRTPEGVLHWDGAGWFWQAMVPAAPSVTLSATTVRLDLQRYLLVECQPAAGRRRLLGASLWVWLEKSRDPGQWLALRRALFAPVHLAGQAGPATR